MKKVDVIIVGQGISGSLLSAELIKNGKTCLVIDEEKEITSSKVSAGLYNPIVFKRVVKSWLIDELLPVLHESYHFMETCCNSSFHTKRKIIKVFVNEDEKLQWLKKAEDKNFDDYLEKEIEYQNFDNAIKSHEGLAYVKNAGNVDVPLMINAWCNFLKSKHSYIAERFEYADIEIINKGIQWKSYQADYLIFCEGYHAHKNPFFNNMPFVPAKGEVLSVKIDHLKTEQSVLNKGVFVLPEGNQMFRVGATYVWDKIDEENTQKGLEELTQKLEKLIQSPYSVVNQKAGIRPSTKDRRPIIGKHSEIPQLVMFNGMGTKAVLLTPYFANQLYHHLYNGKSLHPEVNISRI
jgi:glycine/D-amino acid oxidase-like deaminating enzyme